MMIIFTNEGSIILNSKVDLELESDCIIYIDIQYDEEDDSENHIII